MRHVVFITHPNIILDENKAVTEWSLSALGRARMQKALKHPWINNISAIYSSQETKSIESAEVIAKHCKLKVNEVEYLGENDRSSTGFLVPTEFEAMANQFFSQPDKSVRGWETANNAQQRIVAAVQGIINEDNTKGTIAIVSHGAVGTLLYCFLAKKSIDRKWDQPPNNGGNFYHFQLNPTKVDSGWQPIDI